MREIALENGMCVFSICEITDGISRTIDIIPGSNCHDTYSVAKAFTVTAIGMLEDRGLLHTDDLIFPLLKKHFHAGYDPRWERVSCDHAMTHGIGLDHGILDIDCFRVPDMPSTDFLEMLFSEHLAFEPGTHFQYTDDAFYLMSRVFSAVSGEKLDDFLIRELLVPMKFREYAFSKCPLGYPVGATGMYITTTDMAKLGQLYLQNGIYDGKCYLSEAFIRKALGHFEFKPAVGGGFAKGGMLGQYLYLNKKDNRVIAIHSHRGDIPKLMSAIYS